MNYPQPLQHRPNPMRPLSIDQNTNAFHPQKAQQRIANQQTPCKCSWPKQFVTLSFDWMAVFFLWFYTWKLKIWWMWISSGTESDIGFSHMRGIPKTNESTNCDELEGPLTPVPGSLHQGKDPMCWNCTFFFRNFWGRVPLKLDHISGEIRKWSIHKVEIKYHQPEINLKW